MELGLHAERVATIENLSALADALAETAVGTELTTDEAALRSLIVILFVVSKQANQRAFRFRFNQVVVKSGALRRQDTAGRELLSTTATRHQYVSHECICVSRGRHFAERAFAARFKIGAH